MIRQYIKQAFELMRQERLFSSIYIIGTGLAVSMVMVVAIALSVQVGNIYPEQRRDRMLKLEDTLVKYENSNRTGCFAEQTIRDCFADMEGLEAMTIYHSSSPKIKVHKLQSNEMVEAVSRKVDAHYWKVYDFKFVNGKPFTEADFRSGMSKVVIGEDLAQKLFGTTDAVGREIAFDYKTFQICGVVRATSPLVVGTYAQLWYPFTAWSGYRSAENGYPTGMGQYQATLLVREDANIRAVKQEGVERLRRIGLSVKEGVYDFRMQPWTYMESLAAHRLFGLPQVWLWWSRWAVFFIVLLIIPAVSLSGMADSRMERRVAELGVRRAFGAPKHTLFRQIFVENFIFTLLGGVVGLLISFLLAYVFKDWVFDFLLDPVKYGQYEVNFLPEMFFNMKVFIGALLVCFILNLLTSFIPAWLASRRQIVESINSQTRHAEEGSFFRKIRQNLWMGVELMLVFGLTLYVTDYFLTDTLTRLYPNHRSFDRTWCVGFETVQGYGFTPEGKERQLRDFEMVVRQLEQADEVEVVGLPERHCVPCSGYMHGTLVYLPGDTVNWISVREIVFDQRADFFRTYNYTSPEGKPLSVNDFDWSVPNATLVSESLAHKFFPDGDAVGKIILDANNRERHIIGIVGDVKDREYLRPEPDFYTANRMTVQNINNFGEVCIRLKQGVNERGFAERFKQKMSDRLRIGNYYMESVVSTYEMQKELERSEGFTTQSSMFRTLMGYFLINILLCVMGTFWYRISRRREEIGIRMAMGASRRRIARLFIGEGLAILLIAAIPAMMIVLQLLFTEIIPYGSPDGELLMLTDYPVLRFLVTNLLTGLLLTVVVAVAIFIPVSRAVRISPAEALQEE